MSRPARKVRAKSAAERVRQPTEIRRRLIVEAARGVIAERGLFATTMRDIALAAEVSLGTLTYHFTGIAEILGAVLQDETDSFHAAIMDRALAADDAASAMRTIVDSFFSADERTLQHWRLWLDFWALSAHDDDHAQWQSRSHAQWQQELKQVLERGRDEGLYRIADMTTAVRDFTAIFEGLGVQAFLPHSPMGPAQARRHLLDWIERNLS